MFGTGCGMTNENSDTILRCHNFTIGEYYLDVDANGMVNAFARVIHMNVDRVVKEFGFDNVSEQIQTDYKNNQLSRPVKVIQLIEGNDDRIPDRSDFKNMPYRSLYWEDGSRTDTFLRVSGFEEFPATGARWETRTMADIYGISRGWHALADSKGLQKIKKDYYKGLDKTVDPPMQAPAEMKDIYPINLIPGGITWTTGTAGNGKVEPLHAVNLNLDYIARNIQDVKQELREAFFVDLFLMLTQAESRDMTASAITERHEEKLTVLGPVFGRLDTEDLTPTLNRYFNACNRAGLLPEPPEEIQGNAA
jgi:hypothetical protein